MDYVLIMDKTDAYIKSIVNSSEFNALLKLKDLINNTLSDKVNEFKRCRDLYLEQKQYGEYNPSLKEYRLRFLNAKKELYECDIVKEYFEYQNIIQQRIDEFINKLCINISDKFKNKLNLCL